MEPIRLFAGHRAAVSLCFFYRAIAEKSKTLLKPEGKVFTEINERFGDQVKKLFEVSGVQSVQIIKDIDGKDRVVPAIGFQAPK